MIEDARTLEPKLFLKRKKELAGSLNLEQHVLRPEVDDLISAKISTLAQGGTLGRTSTVLTTAVVGMGKSESCQLASLRANEHGVRLAHFGDGDTKETIKATLDVAYRLGEPLVVVIESPDEIGEAFELSGLIEDEMIGWQSQDGKNKANLFNDRKVYVVVGESRRQYPWMTPHVWWGNLIDKVDLKPFSFNQTREQLGKIGFVDEEAILRIQQFGGIPLVNKLLAENWPNIDAGITEYMEHFLSRIGVEGSGEREEMCSILTHVAILQSFNEDMIPWRLKPSEEIVILSDSSEAGIVHGRNVDQKLRDLGLGKWDAGYQHILGPLRQVLTTHVKSCDPDWLAKAHTGWIIKFRDWAKKYPSGETNWIARAMYHERKLAELLQILS